MSSRSSAGSRRFAMAALLAVLAAACRTAAPPIRPGSPQSAASSLELLQNDVARIFADPALARSYWGVLVRSLRTGQTLVDVNARRLFMPASNMKVVTLAAAAERLGWNYTYDTKLIASGTVVDGALAGDLVVVGSGDPSLMSDEAGKVFDAWAGELKKRGIRTVAGRVVADDNAFDDEEIGFGWSWDDLPDDYAAGVNALQFNESAVRVTIAPGPQPGSVAAVTAVPPTSALRIDNFVTTGAAGSAAAIATRRLPGSDRLEVRGTIAVDAAPAVRLVSVDNPSLFFATALRDALIARGIDVRGPAVDIDQIADARPTAAAVPVATYTSPPLSVLAQRLMKISQNQYAETLLKTMGRAGGGPATAEGGRAAVRSMLENWGVPPGALIQRDGSGLSRYDYVTPEALVTILAHVAADANLRGPFEESLPVLGRDGTLANRLKGTAAEGRVRAKTGSMSNVRSVSGYLTTDAGEPLVFAIIANNFETGADVVNRATDAILVRLVGYR